ncbi:SRPBCC family protein [Streptomyces spectabilis]|uniref:type II toxin-antitoxin system RatA family toxin n=1 Tax=Streptomyces spectabilis TaxID=68270 RepID=UPI0033DB2A7D
MRTIHLRVVVPTDDPAGAFDRLINFTQFASLADDVRSVTVDPGPAPGLPRTADWEVNFRRGVMRWSELEAIDHERRQVEFSQTEGDFEEFHGAWRLHPVDGGCEIAFRATYDFGIESLAGMMDPTAERVIKRSVCQVLSGLFGQVTVVEGGEALTDLAAPGDAVRVVERAR